MCDAIFLPDPADRAAVEAVLTTKKVTWDQMVLWKSDWIWRRVKRFVPRHDILHQRLSAVFQAYGPLKDATTGQPLFNDASWDKVQSILKNVQMGYYSDPPGLRLYTIQGKDKDGLTVYRCLRGTNNVEGGIHQNIAKQFGSFNVSPCLAVNLICDYCLSHNLRASFLSLSMAESNHTFRLEH